VAIFAQILLIGQRFYAAGCWLLAVFCWLMFLLCADSGKSSAKRRGKILGAEMAGSVVGGGIGVFRDRSS
jgi:hypothetical protein